MKKIKLLFVFVIGMIALLSCNHIKNTPPCMMEVKCKSVELSPSGKYRYTFNITNIDTEKSKFDGSITISIVSKEGKSIRYETFEFNDFYSIKYPQYPHDVDVCIEANTGLVNVHGDCGISKYGYSINSNKLDGSFEGFNDINN